MVCLGTSSMIKKQAARKMPGKAIIIGLIQRHFRKYIDVNDRVFNKRVKTYALKH